MSDNRVQVRITGKDELSGVIRSIRGGIASNIGAAVTTVAALSAGIVVAGLALGNFGTGFAKSAELQTQQITNAYSLATVIGSTVSDAKRVTQELNMEMIKLGDTLPGVTEDYQKFARTLSSTVGISSKGDLAAYKKTLTEVAKFSGLMVSTSGADGAQGATALNRYLGGTMSQGEARRQDIFQNNPNYKLFEDQAMKQMGLIGKDFQFQLTTAQRIAVFNLASSLMFTPQMLAAYGATADTQLQALKSKLFNPTTGIFGFSRELKSLGNKTALDKVTGFLIQIDALGTTASGWLSDRGINLDPMLAIGNMMDYASDWAAAFNALMKGDKSGLNTMLSSLKRGLSSIKIEDIVGVLNSAVVLLSSAISSVNWGDFGKGLANELAKAMNTFDWIKAGNTLDQAYFAAVEALANFVKSSGGHLNRAISRSLGYTERNDKLSPTQKERISREDAVKGQFWDNLFGGNRIDPKKSKGAKDFNMSPQSSLPSLGQMGNKGNMGNFSPQINITGGNADSMQQTADYILTAINNQYMQYRDAALV